MASGRIVLPFDRLHKIRELLDDDPPLEGLIDPGFNYEEVPNTPGKRTFVHEYSANIYHKLVSVKPYRRDDYVDKIMRLEHDYYRHKQQHTQLLKERARLPALAMAPQILDFIDKNQTGLIVGHSGCGKTTQIPQIILDAHLQNKFGSVCKIVCVQPRRQAAIGMAHRMAAERAEKVGQTIGYHVSSGKVLPRPRGSILMCTTGVLLRFIDNRLNLDGISHLIIDEVHERDVLTDLTLTVVRQVLIKRPTFKVILLACPLNVRKICGYFNMTACLEIPSSAFYAHEFFLEDALLRTGYVFPYNFKNRMNEHRPSNKEFVIDILPQIRDLEIKRTYPLEVLGQLYREESEGPTMDVALMLLIDLCKRERNPYRRAKNLGSILVFLTGYADVVLMTKLMANSRKFPSKRFLILPLHSKLTVDEQRRVFRKPPPRVRKIVLATNIAETGITIADIVYVIDCGKLRVSDYDAKLNEDVLRPQWISQANCRQRRRLAGVRERGVCYHLFTRARHSIMARFPKPEMLRKRLDDIIMRIKVLRLGAAEFFLKSCLDTPKLADIRNSIEALKRMNALDANEVLTPLGYQLSRIPLAPQIAKLVMLGTIFSCVDAMTNIAATLDHREPFVIPFGKEDLAHHRKRMMAGDCTSDHMLYHYMLFRFDAVEDKKHFCWENFLSLRIMSQLQTIKDQLAETMCDLDFIHTMDAKCQMLNVNARNMALVKALVAGGLYPNIILNHACLVQQPVYPRFYTLDNKSLEFHPKTVMSCDDIYESPFIAYYRKIRQVDEEVYDAGVVHTMPLLFFGDKFRAFYDIRGYRCVSVNDKLVFRTTEETASIIAELRERFTLFLEHKVENHCPVNWENNKEIALLKAIIILITTENDANELEPLYEDTIF